MSKVFDGKKHRVKEPNISNACAHNFPSNHTHTRSSTTCYSFVSLASCPRPRSTAKLFCHSSEQLLCFANRTQLLQLISVPAINVSLFQVLNGHFVHYFAPKDLPVVPKNVVFVIDTSASMLGTKIRQVKHSCKIVVQLKLQEYVTTCLITC